MIVFRYTPIESIVVMHRVTFSPASKVILINDKENVGLNEKAGGRWYITIKTKLETSCFAVTAKEREV